MPPSAEIGVFGGSGFYAFLDDVTEVALHTPYGPPSARISIGDVGGRRVAFLPRHGAHHELPPHRVNYRANVWAMRELGVRRLIGPCACGSLRADLHPGDLVVLDQLVDRTNGRADTYFDGGVVGHVGFADPYCPEVARVVAAAAASEGVTVHERGTVVVIQGPRFSTRAESRWFASQGWEVINMTQYPECVLARELEICYTNVSLITDYDVGVAEDPMVGAVSAEAVVRVFNENNARLRELLHALIPRIPAERACPCGRALQGAIL